MTTYMRNSLIIIFAVITAFFMLAVPAFVIADEETAESTGDYIAMHRFYNPNSGEHFYTADENEAQNLIYVGWSYEGVGWVAPASSNTPVYRLYNSVGGEHHYTMDSDERDGLVSAGWNDEGVGWYSDDEQGMPLYRDYNPNEFANNHNYTLNESEHQNLVDEGWVAEGYAWYSVDITQFYAEDESVSEDTAMDNSEQTTPSVDNNPTPSVTNTDDTTPQDSSLNVQHAKVKVKGYDEFVISIDAESAPITSANFVKLVQSNYYNDLAFYRIDEGFCLQGGTKGNTASGHDPELTPIVGEFSSNNYNNPLADNFKRGTVAMARTNDPNSATSTFFVTLATSNQTALLNGNYAAFGTIDEAGMQVVDNICNDYKQYTSGDLSVISDPAHMPIIESITIAD